MSSDSRELPLTSVMVFRDFFIGDKLLYLLRIEALLLFGGQWQICRDDIRSILLTGFSWNKRPEFSGRFFYPSMFCISTSLTFRKRSEAKMKLFRRSLVDVKMSSLLPSHSLWP